MGSISAKLSRVTSSREYIPEVDGLRFLAILPVLILHSSVHILVARGWTSFTGQQWQTHGFVLRLIGAGWSGVQIFFVISGFIVALPFARHALQGAPAPSLRRYFLRRVTRIEPPYILALTAMFVVCGSYLALLPHYLAGLFYLHQLVFATPNPINTVTWSLEAEVFFYLLAPWLTVVYRVPGRAARWLLQAALIASYSFFSHRWLIPYGPPRWVGTILTALPFFLAGLLLADLYASGCVRRSRGMATQTAWDFAAVGSVAGLIYAANWDWTRFFWLTPFLIMILFLGGMQGGLVNRFLRVSPVTIVGGMCYSAYLWHIPLLIWTSWLTHLIPGRLPDGAAAVLFCAIVVPVLLVATAPLFYYLEKPFMNGPGSRFLEGLVRRNTAPARRAVVRKVA